MELTIDNNIKELPELNYDLENYFRNTSIPQLFFDKDSILRNFTSAAMKQFKLTQDDIGSSIHEIESNLRYPSIIENINWVIATSEILEKEIQTTDFCWYQMNIIPNFEKLDNIPNGVIITFVDITNRKKDLIELEKIIAEYETLFDTISHDIKNRLTSMLLSIQMLKAADFEDQDEIKFLLEMLENGTKQINSIIGELFDSRDHKHKYEAFEELLNIENILEDIQIVLLNEITKTNATIVWEINCSEIVFPRRHLRSILFNLVSNAIKFRSPGRNPQILIRTTREGNYMLITIKDNGIGIDPSKHEDVFSKYFRIEKSVEGSGIGLHLVKKLVTNAGGKLEIESQLGLGTEFKIYLKTECK